MHKGCIITPEGAPSLRFGLSITSPDPLITSVDPLNTSTYFLILLPENMLVFTGPRSKVGDKGAKTGDPDGKVARQAGYIKIQHKQNITLLEVHIQPCGIPGPARKDNQKILKHISNGGNSPVKLGKVGG